MGELIVLITQIFKLFLLGFLGFIVGKTKYFPPITTEILSKFVIKVTVPVLILTSMLSKNFSVQVLLNGLNVFIFGLLLLSIQTVLGYITAGAIRIPKQDRDIFSLQSAFGNIVFVGLPIINLLYGSEGLVYAVFFVFANDLLIFTVGVYLINRDKGNILHSLKNLININIIVYLIGIIMILTGFLNFIKDYETGYKIYNLIYDTFYPLGQSTLYISMIFIGITLSKVNFKNIMGKFVFHFGIVINKLIINPLVAILIIKIFNTNLSIAVIGTIIIQIACPSGTLISMLSASTGKDTSLAVESLFVTTIMCIFSIPFVIYIINIVFA